MSIVITGAAGFIGFHLAKRLLDEREKIVGFDNLNNYYDVSLKKARLKELSTHPNFTFIQGDLADEQAVNALFTTHHPDIVINLAAQAGVRYSITNPRAYMESNMIGFFNILEACRHHPVKHLLYASSSSVYGNQQKTPFSVSDNVDHPISLYAATKKSNELMAYTYSHLYGIPSTGLRFFTVYGPYGRPDMAYYSFTKKILAGEAIQVFNNGDMYRDFTYVDDIVTGIVSMLDHPPLGEDQAECKMQNAKCKMEGPSLSGGGPSEMQNAECKMQNWERGTDGDNGECKVQNAKCKMEGPAPAGGGPSEMENAKCKDDSLQGEAPAKVYNIGNNKPVQLMHFIRALESALSRAYSREIRANIEYLPMQPGDVYQTYADVDDLTRDFGFKPETSIEEGLNHFAVWYKEYYDAAK